MKRLILLIFILGVGVSYAQNSFKGKVLIQGTKIPASNVKVTATNGVNYQTFTNQYGDFVIPNVQSDFVLNLSHTSLLGGDVEISTKQSSILFYMPHKNDLTADVDWDSLDEDAMKMKLDEVVIFTDIPMLKQKSNVNPIGLTSKFDNEKSGMYYNMMALLRTVPGVQVVGDSVIIRGVTTFKNTSSPLFMVDEVYYTGEISDLDPNDIHSIEVVKGSNASIYGMRSANGIVKMFTKAYILSNK